MDWKLTGNIYLTRSTGEIITVHGSWFTAEQDGTRNLGDGDFQYEVLFVLLAEDVPGVRLPCTAIYVQLTSLNSGFPIVHSAQLINPEPGLTCNDDELSVAPEWEAVEE